MKPSKDRSPDGYGRLPDSRRNGRRLRTEPVNQVMDRLFDRATRSRMKGTRAIEMWEQVVGAEIAAIAKATEYAGGVLTVRVTHPVYRVELQQMATDVISQLNERLGEELIRRLRFV